MDKRRWIWIVIPIVICVAVFALTRWHIFIFSHLSEKTEIFKCWVNKLGIWAPAVYLIGYVLRPLIFFPSTPFAILGGVLFGNIWGTLYVLVGTMLSGVCEFFIVRYLVKEKTKQYLKQKAPIANQIVEKHGFLTVFLVRLIPNVAFDLQNCGLALTSIKFRDYFYGTLLGCLPACIFYASFGHYLINRPTPLGLGFAILLIAIFIIFCRFYASKIKNKA